MDIKKENLYVAQKVKTLEAFKSLDNDREFNDLYGGPLPCQEEERWKDQIAVKTPVNKNRREGLLTNSRESLLLRSVELQHIVEGVLASGQDLREDSKHVEVVLASCEKD